MFICRLSNDVDRSLLVLDEERELLLLTVVAALPIPPTVPVGGDILDPAEYELLLAPDVLLGFEELDPP